MAKPATVLHTLVSPNEEENGWFGYSVSGAGDVNGDGHDDIVVGLPGGSPGPSPSSTGSAYIFDGQIGTLLHTLVSPNEELGGQFGISVSGAGDVDGDEHDDVVVGAPNESPGSSPPSAGRAYVFDGQTGILLHTLVSPNEDWGGQFGGSVSRAGDVDGDGHDDIVVGAPQEPFSSGPDGAGRAYVFDGQTGTLLHTLVSPNEQHYGFFGWSVSEAGDVNRDGYDDVVVGAYNDDSGALPEDTGRAYVFDGQTGTLLHTLVSPNEQALGLFGFSVSGAGDVNGDGYDDVAVGAALEPLRSSSRGLGRAYVFDGQTGTLLHTLISPNEQALGYFGFSVSGAGDVDGDGYDDVAVGAFQECPGSSPDDAGRAYVFDCHGAPAKPNILNPTVTGLKIVGPFPNPTTNYAEIMLRIPEGGQRAVDLSLYDVSGHLVERVVNRTVHGGDTMNLGWTPEGTISSGVYWWRLSAGEQSIEKAMVIVR